MHKTQLIFSTLLVLAVIFGSFCGNACEAADAVKRVYTADETKEFKALATATIEAIDAQKEKEMVAKITDLETAWDAKEDTQKPKDPPTWTALDKTLDKAISAIRGSKQNLKKGKAALEDLLKKLDDATIS